MPVKEITTVTPYGNTEVVCVFTPQSEPEPKPVEYALVELKGYNQLCGKIYEVQRFGVTFGCVEILEDGLTKPVLFSGTSVYRVTPMTEQEVKDYYTPPARRPVAGYGRRDDEYDDLDPFAADGVPVTTYHDVRYASPLCTELVATYMLEDGQYNFAGNGFIDVDDEPNARSEDDKECWNCTHWHSIVTPVEPQTRVWDENDDSRR